MSDSSQTAESRLRCKSCGAVLDDSRLEGLCPRCTWDFLSDSDQEIADQSIHSLLAISGLIVLKEIARGGMGIVYLAQQAEPERTVALKMLLPQQLASVEMRERFRLEIQAIAGLEHPSILPVYQVGEHDRLPYFTMKYASRGTLTERIAKLSGHWRAIAELMATLADAVQFAHERGVLHRDLKPGNILFDDEGRAYVSDFGLAKLVSAESDLTRSLEMLGTPHYLAPEIAAHSAKEATTASDIYSLGAILYELLAGRPPFDAQGVPALLRQITDTEPAPPGQVWKKRNAERPHGSDAPRDLEVIALKCLAKEPAKRYGSARELAEDLRRWLEGRTILGRAPTRFERVRAWGRRNPALASLSAVLIIVLAAVTVLEVRSARRLKGALIESLLAQARMSRATGLAGQRFETLSLVKRASDYQLSRRDPAARNRIAALRTEAVGALSLPDLRVLSRWPVVISHYENEFDFTKDLSQYVMASTNGGFAVVDASSGKTIWERNGEPKNPAVELRISGNGKWVVAGCENEKVLLYSIETNLPVRQWQGQAEGIRVFDFAPGDEKLAVGLSNQSGQFEVQVVNLGDGRILATFPFAKPITTAVFSPSADQLAITGDKLTVFALTNSTEIWSVPLTHSASAISWSPDGRRIAIALDRRVRKSAVTLTGNSIIIFDAAQGVQQSVFAQEAERVERLAFHPDSRSLAVASWSADLVWGSIEPDGYRIRIGGVQRALGFSPDGTRLAYAPSKEELGLLEVTQPLLMREWDFRDSPEHTSFTLSVSPDSKWLAAGSQNCLRLWDTIRHVEVASLKLPSNPWYMVVLFAPDGKSIYYSSLTIGTRSVDLLPKTLPNGTETLEFGAEHELKGPGFMAIGYASDGRSLIVGETKRRLGNWTVPLRIWLWPEGKSTSMRTLADDFPMVGYRVIPGGKWGITTDLIEPDLSIWNFETGERVHNLGIPFPVSSELTANGKWLITRTHEEFAVWEVGTWRKVSRWVAPEESASPALIASPDSKWLASGTPNGRISLRRLPEGSEVVTLSPPQRLRPADWAFSRDSKRLFILLQTGHIWAWDLPELKQQLAELGLAWD